MKIIVTGGAGFIGSHLIERLLIKKKIKEIILIDNFLDGNQKNIKSFIKNPKVKIYKKNITKLEKNDKNFKNVYCVYHLAAIADIVPSIENPLEYCETNILGTIRILEAMRFNNVNRIIYSASSSCYGIPRNYPTDEKEIIDTKYPYAFTKHLGELSVMHWSKVYKIKYISLRLFNVYGVRARTTGSYGAVMGIFLKQRLSKKQLTIVGNGNQKRDFIHVKDICEVFIKCLDTKNYNQIYNIGSSKPEKVITLAKKLSKKFIFLPRRPGEPNITYANIRKAKIKLKWKPKITFNKGIINIIDNISYWKNAPLWNKKKISKATKNWFKYLK